MKIASTIALTILVLKQVGFTIAGVAIAIFYIRWLNRWFEQHSQAEFQLKQFQLDIDRASWAVETALEWSSSLEALVPVELLESITRNLFVLEAQSSDEESYPADKLASALLGTASKL